MSKPLTYEQVLELIAETSLQIKAASMETEKRIREIGAEIRAAAAESDKRMEEGMQKRMEEEKISLQKRMEEEKISLQKRMEETDRNIAEMKKTSDRIDQRIEKVSKQLGDITDTLGRFAEEQVLPRIIEMFKARNIHMEAIFRNVLIEREDGDFLLEIDMLLVNTTYSIVVEVKNSLRQKDIDLHLKRLEKIQNNPTKLKYLIKDTIMLSAIAGMVVRKEVERYALQKGLFVIKPNGNGVDIINPPNFKAKEWLVK